GGRQVGQPDPTHCLGIAGEGCPDGSGGVVGVAVVAGHGCHVEGAVDAGQGAGQRCEHARYGSVMVAGPTRASLGPRSSRCGMLIDVELDPVVSVVSRTYLELVDAALPAFHQADDTAAS